MGNEPKTFEEALDCVLAEMRSVMIDRQRKYGPANMLEAGVLGAIDRASKDKINRIRRYYERELLRTRCSEAGMPQPVIDEYLPMPEVDDESIDDTHIDAANYLGPICLMLRRGWWTLPFESQSAQS